MDPLELVLAGTVLTAAFAFLAFVAFCVTFCHLKQQKATSADLAAFVDGAKTFFKRKDKGDRGNRRGG